MNVKWPYFAQKRLSKDDLSKAKEKKNLISHISVEDAYFSPLIADEAAIINE